MKSIIEFELPEDKSEFEAASKAIDLAIFLFDIEQYLRVKIKYNEEDKSAEYIKALEEFRTWFFEEKPVLEHFE